MILIIFDELSTERTRDLPKSTLADHMQLKIWSFDRIVRCKPSKSEQKWRGDLEVIGNVSWAWKVDMEIA